MKAALLMLVALSSLHVLRLNAASPVISVGTASIIEGDTGNQQIIFAVNLSTASAIAVSFTYGTINGPAVAPVDYDGKGGTMILPAGATNGSMVIVTKGDRIPEGDEFFFVRLSSPTNATFATNLIRGIIRDDDFRLISSTGNGSTPHFSFASVNHREHRVQRTLSLNPFAVWEPVPGAESITGNGGLIDVSDPGVQTEPQKFYRVQLMPARTTNMTIHYVGNTPLNAYRTTTAPKPLDPDGNIVFGTAGYVMYATDVIGSGNSGTTAIVNPLSYASGTRRTRLGLPAWLSLQNNGQDRIAASYGSYPAIDDPTLVPSPSVNDVQLGYAVRLAAFDTEATMVNIWFGNGVPSGGVRIGVACPANGLDAIAMIRLTNSANADATAFRVGGTAHTLYFFDVVGVKPGDFVKLLLQKSSATGGNQNLACAGLTFDTLPSLF